MRIANNILVLLVSLLNFASGAAITGNGTAYAVEIENQTTVSKGQIQPQIAYANVWADESGATHIVNCEFEGLALQTFAPPATPEWVGVSPDEVDHITYGILPVGYVGSWHHAPSPQWIVILSGAWSVETTDGNIIRQGAGEMQFNAETDARPRGNDTRVGHITRNAGDIPCVQLIISLRPNTTAFENAKCAY